MTQKYNIGKELSQRKKLNHRKSFWSLKTEEHDAQ